MAELPADDQVWDGIDMDELFREMDAAFTDERCLRTRPRLPSGTARRLYAEPIPEGFELHHLCKNRWCGNPAHLIAVSPNDHRKLHRKESFCA